MGGNRKHGFLRGNRGGVKPDPWFCDACQKKHEARRSRNGTLDGRSLCDRAYYREASAKLAAERRNAALAPSNGAGQASATDAPPRVLVTSASSGKSNVMLKTVSACMSSRLSAGGEGQ